MVKKEIYPQMTGQGYADGEKSRPNFMTSYLR